MFKRNLNLFAHFFIRHFLNMRLNFYLLKRFRKVHRDGVLYHLDLQKLIDMHIYLDSWEPWNIEVLKRILSSGDIVIEAGANIGAHSLIMGNLIGPNGRLYAFEPTNYAFEKLDYLIKLNSLGSVITPERTVLSNHSGELPITSMVSEFMLFSTSDGVGEDISSSQVTSIDNYVLLNNICSLKLIKIDVDGYDFKVLSGALNSIANFRPIIMIELADFTLKRQGDSINDIINFLHSQNYVGYYLSSPFGKNIWANKINNSEEVLIHSGATSHVDSLFLPVENQGFFYHCIFEDS